MRQQRSKESHANQITNQLMQSAAGIIDRRYYFDQIKIWTREHLTKPQIQAVRSGCTKFHPDTRTSRENRFHMSRAGWKASYVAFQPKEEAILRLIECCPAALVNYVEVSIELITASEEEKQFLFSFLEQHAWHGKRSAKEVPIKYFDTLYSGSRTARSNLVCYADRAAKLSTDPHCVKLELRLRGSQACKSRGIRALNDLLGFEHRRFWTSRLKLAAVNLPKLELYLQNSGRIIKLKEPQHTYRPYPKANFLCNIAVIKGKAVGQLRRFQCIKDGWQHLSSPLQQRLPLPRFTIRLPSGAILGPP